MVITDREGEREKGLFEDTFKRAAFCTATAHTLLESQEGIQKRYRWPLFERPLAGHFCSGPLVSQVPFLPPGVVVQL